MNQQCKVCGEPAAGFHFGAFTCEGCKSFFGRTYNNLSSISECKNNGECVINKKNRTSCKACRLRKCLKIGMSKSGSRYGRRSNWFKIHCLLQEQQQNKANNNNDSGNKLKDLNDSSSNLLQNDLVSTQFLANLYSHNNNNIIKDQLFKQQSSPSDSGASSSADLEESYIKMNNNNCPDFKNICETENVKSTKFEPEAIKGINNLIQPPVSSFLPYNLHQTNEIQSISDFYKLQLPQISITPNPVKKSPFEGGEQNEPIDLSIKASKSQNPHENGSESSDPDFKMFQTNNSVEESSKSPINLDHKPVPLDLTLLRTNSILERR